MKSRNILPLTALLTGLLSLSSCEKAQPFLDKMGEALNRETPEEKARKKVDIEEKLAEAIPPPPEPVKMEPVINKEARVSVLGYHDFTEGVSKNDMIINVDTFREQMQAIKDSEIPVITMQQFLDWRAGKKDIPPEALMITIDDGWKATHNLAMGVMKEYEFPFTVFLYKNYVGVGGKSMTYEEIREIARNGGTICSHSVSHGFMGKKGGRSQANYEEWLKTELVDSHVFLEENFGDTKAVVKTFAYPYGSLNDDVLRLTEKYGYAAGFTVNGEKVTWETPMMKLGRYIVHGKKIANFEPALNFGTGRVTSSGRKLITESRGEDGEKLPPLITLYPPKESTIKSRMPKIEADLSKLAGVQADSISMRVAGFGRVPHIYDPATGMVTFQVPQRIRLEECGVQLSFRHAGNRNSETIGWSFKIDKVAEYFNPENSEPRKPRELSAVEPKEEAPVAADDN